MAVFFDVFYPHIWIMIEMTVGFYFYTGFLKEKAKFVHYMIIAAAVAAITVVCPGGSTAEFFLCVFLLAVMGRSVCRGKHISVLPYAVITVEIIQLCNGIFNPLSIILAPAVFRCGFESAGLIFELCGNAGAFAVSVFCYWITGRYFLYDEAGRVQKHSVVILLPALLIFLISQYISAYVYGNTVVLEMGGNMAGTGQGHIFVIQVAAIICLFCILYAYKKLLENFCFSERAALLEQETVYLQEYVEEAKMRYEKTRAFRHDVRNHMTVIKELIRKGRTEQALAFIGDMEDTIEDMTFPCSTNHPVLDILIGNKLGTAVRSGICVSCSIAVPYPCGVSDIDLCILFSNGLDNAVRACKKMKESSEKYIGVSGKVQGDFLLIEIENSTEGEKDFKKGTGIGNIDAVVEKYQGAVKIDTGHNRFTLSILLIIPQHPESNSRQNAEREDIDSRMI